MDDGQSLNRNRRNFIQSLAALTGGSVFLSFQRRSRKFDFPISCSSYDWVTFYERQGKEWGKDLDSGIAEFAQTGIKALEPSITSVEQVRQLMPVLNKYQIALPSAYVNSMLHRKEEAQNSIRTVLEIADELQKHDTRILVTNPSPIRWGGAEVKTDEELLTQSHNLELLGKELRERGMILAYHTHDTEMLAGAREFHHMLVNTSDENVSFCFDVHWVYRGSGNSTVAVFDVLKLYGHRIAELHLRQSRNGVWREVFGDGDIDYVRLAAELHSSRIKPHLVIEQCIEEGSPAEETAVSAHVKDLKAVTAVFEKVINR